MTKLLHAPMSICGEMFRPGSKITLEVGGLWRRRNKGLVFISSVFVVGTLSMHMIVIFVGTRQHMNSNKVSQEYN